MNYNVSILAAFIFLIAATTAERLSDWHVKSLLAERADLKVQVNKLEARTDQALNEGKQYQEAEAVAAKIKSAMTLQGDSTSLIQWFDTAAKNWGVVLLDTKVIPSERPVEPGAFRRIRMEARLNGAYLGLLQYVESVERASIPMVVDSVSLAAVRELPGTGDLVLNVSCLFPTTPAGKSARTDGAQ